MRRADLAVWLALNGGLAGCSAAPGVPPAPIPLARAPESVPSATAPVAVDVPLTGPWVELESSSGAPALERGAEAVRAREWRRAQTELGAAIAALEGARLDERLAGWALHGRAARENGDVATASQAFEQVLSEWKGAQSVAALRALPATADERDARLRRALSAVAEALFQRGERDRGVAEAIALPAYAGKGDTKSIRVHLETKVAAWTKQRRAAIETAEASFAAIDGLEPAAPPRWVVRSAARSGMMWGRFAAEFRAAPIPREWQQTGPVPGVQGVTWQEVRASYHSALDKVSAPIHALARTRFERCASEANEHEHQDEFSKHCSAWLASQAR